MNKEHSEFVTGMLAKKFADTAMRIFVNITPEARQVLEELDAVTDAMRAESRVQLDKMMQGVRESPWLSQQYFALATMEVAQAGKRKVLELIKEKEMK